MESKNVLITFGRMYLSLDLARKLHAAGHRVYVADSMRYPYTRFSNAVEKAFRTPPPRYQPRAYVAELARIVREYDIDLLVPMHEETDIIAAMADEFPSSCRLFLSDAKIESTLSSKLELQRALESLDFPVLEYAEVNSPSDFDALDFDVDFAFKQAHSRATQNVFHVRPGDPPPDVEYTRGNPWLAQEWLAGTPLCSYSVCDQGTMLAHTVYPREYSLHGISCISYYPVQHPGIKAWVEEFVARVGFTGQLAFDFIEHPERGLFAIECNPRATSGLMLFGSDIDGPLLGVDAPLLEPDPSTHRMMGAGMVAFGWLPKNRPDGKTFLQYLHDLRTIDDVVTDRDDPGPSLAMPLTYSEVIAMCGKYHVGIAEGFLHDHNWDGESL